MSKAIRNVLLVVIVLAAAAVFGFRPGSSATPTATSTLATSTASISTATNAAEMAELKVGTSTYSLPVHANETALDLMRTAASSTSFRFSGKEYPSMGLFVDSIDGIPSHNGMDWFLYLNGKSSELGASEAPVHAGDVVEWRFEKDHY